jgi:hypothetical protein
VTVTDTRRSKQTARCRRRTAPDSKLRAGCLAAQALVDRQAVGLDCREARHSRCSRQRPAPAAAAAGEGPRGSGARGALSALILLVPGPGVAGDAGSDPGADGLACGVLGSASRQRTRRPKSSRLLLAHALEASEQHQKLNSVHSLHRHDPAPRPVTSACSRHGRGQREWADGADAAARPRFQAPRRLQAPRVRGGAHGAAQQEAGCGCGPPRARRPARRRLALHALLHGPLLQEPALQEAAQEQAVPGRRAGDQGRRRRGAVRRRGQAHLARHAPRLRRRQPGQRQLGGGGRVGAGGGSAAAPRPVPARGGLPEALQRGGGGARRLAPSRRFPAPAAPGRGGGLQAPRDGRGRGVQASRRPGGARGPCQARRLAARPRRRGRRGAQRGAVGGRRGARRPGKAHQPRGAGSLHRPPAAPPPGTPPPGLPLRKTNALCASSLPPPPAARPRSSRGAFPPVPCAVRAPPSAGGGCALPLRVHHWPARPRQHGSHPGGRHGAAPAARRRAAGPLSPRSAHAPAPRAPASTHAHC